MNTEIEYTLVAARNLTPQLMAEAISGGWTVNDPTLIVFSRPKPAQEVLPAPISNPVFIEPRLPVVIEHDPVPIEAVPEHIA